MYLFLGGMIRLERKRAERPLDEPIGRVRLESSLKFRARVLREGQQNFGEGKREGTVQHWVVYRGKMTFNCCLTKVDKKRLDLSQSGVAPRY